MENLQIYFAYIIESESEEKFYYTNFTKDVNFRIDSKIQKFLSKYSIGINFGSFDDSLQNNINLKGYLTSNDNDFLDKIHNGGRVKIYLYYPQKNIFKKWKYYHIENVIINDSYFQIYLTSPSKILNSSLVDFFSKDCRANFGDYKCKIDKNLFTKICTITRINSNIIYINSDIEEGYYDNGEAFFDDRNDIFKIKKNGKNYIILDREICECDRINIIPTCNKTLSNCAKKFNNAINFRGEPFVPVTNMLKFND